MLPAQRVTFAQQGVDFRGLLRDGAQCGEELGVKKNLTLLCGHVIVRPQKAETASLVGSFRRATAGWRRERVKLAQVEARRAVQLSGFCLLAYIMRLCVFAAAASARNGL